MPSVNVTIRMDENDKKNAEKLFSELGLTMNAAFNMFAKQAVREQAIPFKITIHPDIKHLDRDSLENLSDESNKKHSKAYEGLSEANEARNLVQFSVDEISKIQAALICNQLGIDLQTYLRMCIARLIDKNGIPFDMVLNNGQSEGMDALLEAGRISKENGNSEMTLDEINEEIRLAREEIDARKNKIK